MGERIVADHRRILREGLPLIDLRAPTEFALGAFPGAVNLPLLTDAERAAVGTRYKQCGQQAAIALGEELVSGATRTERIDSWRTFIATHPGTLLYCWRGGLRSQIAQEWLRDSGVEVARIAGGYKTLRRTCLASDRGVLRHNAAVGHRRPDRFRENRTAEPVRCDHRSGTPGESSRVRFRFHRYRTTDADRVREPACNRNARRDGPTARHRRRREPHHRSAGTTRSAACRNAGGAARRAGGAASRTRAAHLPRVRRGAVVRRHARGRIARAVLQRARSHPSAARGPASRANEGNASKPHSASIRRTTRPIGRGSNSCSSGTTTRCTTTS